MAKSVTIEIDGVGPVLFERSRRAKHVNISVRPFDGVRVAVPYGLSFKKAEKIVHSRKEWIQKHLVKMEQIRKKHEFLLGSSVRINRTLARRRLIKRLNELAEEHGFTYNRVFIRNQKSRWGSCSSRNNISLNVKLVRLPDELVDYVILHELVHIRVKNHSKVFWTELSSLVGDAKKMRSRMKEYALALS
jgi:predicted metal-dependent hydrolase